MIINQLCFIVVAKRKQRVHKCLILKGSKCAERRATQKSAQFHEKKSVRAENQPKLKLRNL